MRGEGSIGASTGAPKDQKWPKLTKILNCFLNKARYTNRHSCGYWAGAVMWRARAIGGARYTTADYLSFETSPV